MDGQAKATAKGINTVVKEEVIKHKDYKDCLFNQEQKYNVMTRIIQDKHELFTAEVNKKSLSPFNDKKYITREGDEIISYSFGHYKISEM